MTVNSFAPITTIHDMIKGVQDIRVAIFVASRRRFFSQQKYVNIKCLA